MLFNKSISYEVLTGQGERWLIDTSHTAKTDALARAQSLLQSNQHDAIRVLKLENDANEEVIFQQECAGRTEKPITISAIESTNFCDNINEFYGFESRKTAGRLLREYLDEWGITAFELYYSYEHNSQLARMETLYDQAIHRIASIQARAVNAKASDRSEVLYTFADEVKNRARKASIIPEHLSLLSSAGFSATLNELKKSTPPSDIEFVANVTLANHLNQKRDWKQKLELVVDLLELETDKKSISVLDQICAEVLDGAAATKEILGAQADLLSALQGMIKLAKGKKTDNQDVLGRFSSAIHNHILPMSRQILIDRVIRAVSGTAAFTRGDDETDKNAFLSIFKTLIGRAGFIGGREMSQALTRRIRIIMKTQDGDLAPEDAIQSVLSNLPIKITQIGYLLDLSSSDFGSKYQLHVMEALAGCLKSISTVTDLMPTDTSSQAVGLVMKELQSRLNSDLLGAEINALLDAKLRKFLNPAKAVVPDQAKVSAKIEPEIAKEKSTDLGGRFFKTNDIIFNEGDHGDEAFMIVSGEVEIFTKSGDRRVVLATLGRGEIIGEMALIDNHPRMATAKALADTTLTIIPQEAFQKRFEWLREEDRLFSHLLEIFVDRLRKQAQFL